MEPIQFGDFATLNAPAALAEMTTDGTSGEAFDAVFNIPVGQETPASPIMQAKPAANGLGEGFAWFTAIPETPEVDVSLDDAGATEMPAHSLDMAGEDEALIEPMKESDASNTSPSIEDAQPDGVMVPGIIAAISPSVVSQKHEAGHAVEFSAASMGAVLSEDEPEWLVPDDTSYTPGAGADRIDAPSKSHPAFDQNQDAGFVEGDSQGAPRVLQAVVDGPRLQPVGASGTEISLVEAQPEPAIPLLSFKWGPPVDKQETLPTQVPNSESLAQDKVKLHQAQFSPQAGLAPSAQFIPSNEVAVPPKLRADAMSGGAAQAEMPNEAAPWTVFKHAPSDAAAPQSLQDTRPDAPAKTDRPTQDSFARKPLEYDAQSDPEQPLTALPSGATAERHKPVGMNDAAPKDGEATRPILAASRDLPNGEQQPATDSREPRDTAPLSTALPADRATETIPTLERAADDPVPLNGTSFNERRALADAPLTPTVHHVDTRRAEVARSVGQQMAAGIAMQQDRPVELTLAPEELGRVRLSLQSHDQTMVVTVQADRNDTLDLMRRHIDSLSREFREMGYSDVSFSFSQNPHQDQPAPQSAVEVGASQSESVAAELTPSPHLQPIRISLDSDGRGLDLRI